MRYWIATVLFLGILASVRADIAPVALPAGFGPPVPAPTVGSFDESQRAATRDLNGSWTWHRLNTAAQQAAPPSGLYVASIRGTLFSWSHYWNQSATPPDGTVAELPDNTYHPPEGQPPVDPTSGLPDPTGGRIPSPGATVLGIIGLALLQAARRRL